MQLLNSTRHFFCYSLIPIFLALTVCLSLEAQSANQNTYAPIIKKFEQWKLMQYKSGKYADEKNCNPDTVNKRGYKGADAGIPNDIDISFTYLNDDDKMDALIIFRPYLCDGGVALKNKQVRILVLSAGEGYSIADKWFDKIEAQFNSGHLFIENASWRFIYGTLYEQAVGLGQKDSIVSKPFSIDNKTRKLTFLNHKQ